MSTDRIERGRRWMRASGWRWVAGMAWLLEDGDCVMLGRMEGREPPAGAVPDDTDELTLTWLIGELEMGGEL